MPEAEFLAEGSRRAWERHGNRWAQQIKPEEGDYIPPPLLPHEREFYGHEGALGDAGLHPFPLPPAPAPEVASEGGFISSAISRRARPERSSEVFEAQVEMYSSDTVVRFTTAKKAKMPAPPRKRGKVRRFSSRSRRRVVFKLRNAKAEWRSLVTLTYPGVFPTARESKRHLDNFLRRVRRKWKGIAYVWVLEWQERGAPHYHLLFDQFIPAGWLSRAWYEVVGSGDERHLRAGTKVEAPRSQGGIIGYLTKYFGKLEQKTPPEDWPGRFWGCSRGLVDTPLVAYFRGSFREVSRAIRLLRKAKSRYHRNRWGKPWRWRHASFTVWGIPCRQAIALLKVAQPS